MHKVIKIFQPNKRTKKAVLLLECWKWKKKKKENAVRKALLKAERFSERIIIQSFTRVSSYGTLNTEISVYISRKVNPVVNPTALVVLGNFEVNAASSHSYKMEWKVMWKERTAKCQWYGLSSKRLTGYFMYCRQKHRPLKAKSSLDSRKIGIVNLPLHLWQLTK